MGEKSWLMRAARGSAVTNVRCPPLPGSAAGEELMPAQDMMEDVVSLTPCSALES